MYNAGPLCSLEKEDYMNRAGAWAPHYSQNQQGPLSPVFPPVCPSSVYTLSLYWGLRIYSFPVPGTLFPQIFSWIILSCSSGLCSSSLSPKNASLTAQEDSFLSHFVNHLSCFISLLSTCHHLALFYLFSCLLVCYLSLLD